MPLPIIELANNEPRSKHLGIQASPLKEKSNLGEDSSPRTNQLFNAK